jgi:hypothetical protein
VCSAEFGSDEQSASVPAWALDDDTADRDSYEPRAPLTTNGLAIASMVLGIVWLYGVGSILALVFGYIAKNQVDLSGGRQAGRGMAIAGIVLGWVGVGVVILVSIGLASRSNNTYGGG